MKNNTTYFCLSSLRVFFVGLLFACLSACANGLEDHDFSFDAVRDSPNIEILNYRYGDSKQPGARPSDWQIQAGKIPQGTGIHGDMLRGDSLFVKWRVRDTGKVFEDTVDLKATLPRTLKDHKIYFIVKDQQLFVYLITPERLPPDAPPNGPRKYDYLKVITLSSNFGREVNSK